MLQVQLLPPLPNLMLITDPVVKTLLLQELYQHAIQKEIIISPRGMYILLQITRGILLEQGETVRIDHRSQFASAMRKNRPLFIKIIPYIRNARPYCKTCKHAAGWHDEQTLICNSPGAQPSPPTCTCPGLVIQELYD